MKWRDTGWDGAEHAPRKWQREAVSAAIEFLLPGRAGVIQAVMGAGKSIVIAELCASARLGSGETIVISTSSQRLVEQLSETVRGRGLAVGKFYQYEQAAHRRIVVTTTASIGKLAARLDEIGRRCVLWIADEAHKTECDSVLLAAEGLRADRILGVTATPYRSLVTEELSIFTDIIYDYPPADALRDGVILPWKVLPWRGGQTSEDEAAIAMIAENMHVGPGVCNAYSIEDAQTFAAQLRRAGIRAEAIHSRQDRATQATLLGELERGEQDLLVHVSMLQEGVDLPWLRWLCLRRAASSRVRFAQEVGRVLRVYPGKSVGYILDVHDLFAEKSLTYDAVLYGQADETAAASAIEIRRAEDGWWSTAESPLLAGIGEGSRVKVHRPHLPREHELLIVEEIRRDGLHLPAIGFDEDRLIARQSSAGLSDPDAAAERMVRHGSKPHEVGDAESLDDTIAYLRDLTIGLEQEGCLERKVASRSWRSLPQTARQRAFALRLLAGFAKRRREGRLSMPPAHRAGMRVAVRTAQAGELDRGGMSDLIDIMTSLLSRKEWPLKGDGK